MDYLTLAAGLALLLICGDALVRGAIAIAEQLSIPPIIIGLTIVAFGTSAPELVISLRAAILGSPGIALGNVVGSNIANILLVLGLPALICSTNCDQPNIARNTIYVIGASLVFIWLCALGPLTFWHGAVLFTLMILFLIESGRRAVIGQTGQKEQKKYAAEMLDDVSGIPNNIWLITSCIIIGLVGLPFGAHIIVISAQAIANSMGVSETAIGLSVVALGTSLPELATTLSAALRKCSGLVFGNVLGSNLFNLLAIMGLTSMVTPVTIPKIFFELDLWVMLGATLLIVPFVLKRTAITRIPAFAFVTGYFVYIYFVFSPHMAKMAMTAQ